MRATGGLAAIRRGVAGLLPRVPLPLLLLLLLLGPAAAPAQAPAAELAALYHERWEIEGALAELKTQLRGRVSFSAVRMARSAGARGTWSSTILRPMSTSRP